MACLFILYLLYKKSNLRALKAIFVHYSFSKQSIYFIALLCTARSLDNRLHAFYSNYISFPVAHPKKHADKEPTL